MSKRNREILIVLCRSLFEFIFAALGMVMVTVIGLILSLLEFLVIGNFRISFRSLFNAWNLVVMGGLKAGSDFVTSCLQLTNDIVNFTNDSFSGEILEPEKKAEKWAIALGWWIPRKYRGTIVGDILEDCDEMRKMRCSEWRIRIQVLWQWSIAIGTLIPAALVGAVWRMVIPPK